MKWLGLTSFRLYLAVNWQAGVVSFSEWEFQTATGERKMDVILFLGIAFGTKRFHLRSQMHNNDLNNKINHELSYE
ncbi:MAG: hypothetical protein D6160_18010 [Ketobacter sp.]|nr:MAG: hypothetical protein D6160_18010 [Ketobacter sp.]